MAGNDQADRLAKLGTLLPPQSESRRSTHHPPCLLIKKGEIYGETNILRAVKTILTTLRISKRTNHNTQNWINEQAPTRSKSSQAYKWNPRVANSLFSFAMKLELNLLPTNDNLRRIYQPKIDQGDERASQIAPTSKCQCGFPMEDIHHLLVECTLASHLRNNWKLTTREILSEATGGRVPLLDLTDLFNADPLLAACGVLSPHINSRLRQCGIPERKLQSIATQLHITRLSCSHAIWMHRCKLAHDSDMWDKSQVRSTFTPARKRKL